MHFSQSNGPVSNSLGTPLTLCLLALLTASTLGVRQFDPISPQDEGILLVYPDLILRGFTPYRDFAAIYGPGNFYVIAAVFAVLGESVIAERIVGLSYQFLIIASCFLIGARVSWIIGLLSSLASLLALLCFSVPGAYSMFGALVPALLALYIGSSVHADADPHRQRRWAMLAGIFSGLIYWFRLDVGFVGSIAALVAVDPRNFFRLRCFLTGFAFPVLSAAIFVLMVGPLYVFDSLVLDPLRIGPGRVLPIQLTWNVVTLICCVVISAGVGIAARTTNFRAQFVWLARGIATFSIGLMPLALQRLDLSHTTYIGTAVAGLAIVSLGILFTKLDLPSPSPRIAIALYIMAAAIALSADPFVRRPPFWQKSSEISSNGRAVYAPFWQGRGSPADLNRLLEDVNRAAQPGDTVFVGPRDLRFAVYNDTFIYYLLPNLRPISRYLEMNPGMANGEHSGLAQQVAMADWLILTTRYENWREPNTSIVPGPSLPNELVNSLFCPRAIYGAWSLLRRCSASGREE